MPDNNIKLPLSAREKMNKSRDEFISFINENNEHLAIIKKGIELYNTIRLSYSEALCGICDKVLDQGELMERKVTDFNFCCRDHTRHRDKIQRQMVRTELGYTEETQIETLIKMLLHQ